MSAAVMCERCLRPCVGWAGWARHWTHAHGGVPADIHARRFPEFLESHTDYTDDCWEWTGGRTRKGYGSVWFAGIYYGTAHQFAYRRSVGPIPDGLCVLHSCDNPPCVRPTHLFLGTNADNVADRMAKGRNPTKATRPEVFEHLQGEGNYAARLTERQVVEIRQASGRHHEIAARYGVSRELVSRIRRRAAWRHVA